MQRSSGTLSEDSTHRVRRLRFQARAPNAADAFALQRLLHQQAEAVSAALDDAFARLTNTALDPGQVWHLPSLTLRLDATSLAQLDTDLPTLVSAALQDALHNALQASTPPATPHGLEAAAKPVADQVRLSTSLEAGLDALRTYLATGSLPWVLAGLGPQAQQHSLQLAAGAALDDLLRTDSASRATALAKLLSLAAAPASRIGALLRWLALLTAGQRQRWLAHSPPPAGIAPALAQAWLALLANPGTPPEWTALWLVWPTLTAPSQGVGTGAANSSVASPEATALARWIAGLPAGSTNVELPATSLLIDTAAHDRSLAAALLRSLGGAVIGADTATTRTAVPPVKPPTSTTPAGATQLVPLAGLVLLHHYLPRFLGGCGLLDRAGRAIPDAQLPRACAVLHVLACGETGIETTEYQLPLIKLLLGREPDEPLTAALPRPDASDLVEIDSMLTAVRGHWKALGNTSAEGLRLSFLQRRGLLRHADGAWQLNMQTESFDMLLDLLPWSISVVKLPWMPHPLMVEWRAGAP